MTSYTRIGSNTYHNWIVLRKEEETSLINYNYCTYDISLQHNDEVPQ